MSDLVDAAGAGSAVWLMGLFLGVAYWAFRPGRRPSGRRQRGPDDEHGNSGA